jgi:hypothetical protein
MSLGSLQWHPYAPKKASGERYKAVLTSDDTVVLSRLMGELPVSIDGQSGRISPRWHMAITGRISGTPRGFPRPEYNRNIYVLAALTLSLLPNVETFTYAHFPGSFIACGSGPLPRQAELFWGNTSWGDGPQLRDAIITAPRLKHLSGDGGFSAHKNLHCPVLKTLDFECRGLDGEGLRALVQKIDGLESFSYRFNFMIPGRGSASPREVYEALISAKDTLTTLNLTFTDHNKNFCVTPSHLHLQTLQDLSVLETVHLSDTVIFWGRGDDNPATRGPHRLTGALPQSIREFSLDLPLAPETGRGINAESYLDPYPHLIHLAESIPDQFPNLKVVRIRNVLDGRKERLEVAFTQKGVAITMLRR